MKDNTPEENKPQPTIGRIVHFKPYGAPDRESMAAIVAGVHETTVDLWVFARGGLQYVEDVNHGDREGQWSWPPRE